jgi:tetratricopeptide (TPR) repeat protein
MHWIAVLDSIFGIRCRAPGSAVLLVGLLACLSSQTARADMLLLKDGRVIERPKMEQVEAGVKVHFENGEILVPAEKIETAIIESAPPYVAKTPEEQAQMDKGLVPFEGEWIKPDKRAKLIEKRIAERKEMLEEIKAHTLWRNRWTDKSKHFEFEYTVPPSIAEHYRDLMEAYYKAFAKDWKVGQPRDLGRLKVCFYINRSDFLQIGGVSGGVLAYFRFVQPLELNFFYDRLDPALTEQVMYHEANHYLQYLLNPGFSMPHFPGEALAEYYGASVYDPKTKKLETGQVLEGRLTEIQLDVLAGEMLGLEKMITTDRMYEHYTWGWSLAHYLMGDKRYRKKFERFVKELASGKGVSHVPYQGTLKTVKMPQVWEHFKKTLGLSSPEDVLELEQEWHEYVKQGLQVVTARGLEKAATRAMNSGRVIRAKRLFKEAIEKGTDSAMAYHHYAELLERDGKRAEALQHHRKAVELAPLESQLYVSLGQALRYGSDKEEGKRLLALALELDPDNPWLAREVESALEDD